MFEWRKSVQYWWSYILFSPECRELTSMLDPLLYRWGVPPVVIRCVHWTMQMWVLQTWIIALGFTVIMCYKCLVHLDNQHIVTLHSSSPWGFGVDLKCVIFRCIVVITFMGISSTIAFRMLLMISQHWLRKWLCWLSAIRQQAINWTKIAWFMTLYGITEHWKEQLLMSSVLTRQSR